MKRTLLVLLLGLLCSTFAVAEEAAAKEPAPKDPKLWFTPEHATAKLLILGTFHFKDAGLDDYKPEVDIDILSENRQAELADVLERLAEFAPTKILIESKPERQGVMDERYNQFLAGEFELQANEIYQLAFRLGKKLGHDRLYGVDVSGRNYKDLPDSEAYAIEHGQEFPQADLWNERFTDLYRVEDRAKASRTLRETLLYLNSADRLRTGHGHYVLSYLGLGVDEEFPGTDSLTGWWYNRNLRIYSRILRTMEPGDRLLLLIGAGHVPIIQHAADASPEIDLIEVSEVLN
jgi:hypothetical protein